MHQALSMIERQDQRVALVLLDLTMPVLDGEATARQLKALHPELPVVLSSGYNEADARRRFADCGLDAHIQKPYRTSDLAETLTRVLAHSPRARACRSHS
jgi:CheY-like chemotaxis protein